MKRKYFLVGASLSFLMALGVGATLIKASPVRVNADINETRTLYLDLNESGWENDNAKFAVWCHTPNESTWSDFMSPVDGMEHMYSVDVNGSFTTCNFVRLNPSYTDPSWDAKWGQTDNADVDNKNCCKITGWEQSNFVTYSVNPVEDGYYLVGTMNSWTADDDSKMTKNNDLNEYYLEASFETNDEFKVVNYSRYVATYYGYEVLEGGSGSAKDVNQIVAADESDKPNMKVNVSGTYTPYFKLGEGGSRSIWISAIEVTHVYLLEVTHSDTTKSQYNVVLNADTEYMTEENVPVVAGDTLAFYIDGALQTVNPKLIGNNNCYSNDGVTTVRLNMNSKIYVDFTNGTCFCDGMIAGEYGLVVNNNYIRMSHNDNPADPTFDEWYKQGYSFAKDDVIQFVNTTSTTDVASVFSVTKINPSSAQGFAIVDDKLVCTAEGGKSTDIYVKFKYGADEVYFGDVAEDLQAAINYAKLFNIQMNSICTLDDTTSKDDMQNAWMLAEADFGMLIESSQNILKNATTSHANDDIKAFVAQYDYIIAKYGTKWSLNNFVSRTPVSLAMFQNNFVGVTSENTIQIVVIVAVVAVTAAGAFLFIKYRKEN